MSESDKNFLVFLLLIGIAFLVAGMNIDTLLYSY